MYLSMYKCIHMYATEDCVDLELEETRVGTVAEGKGIYIYLHVYAYLCMYMNINMYIFIHMK